MSNIAYAGVNDIDIVDRNFCFDTYVLLTKNMNPFSLEKKISDQSKHKMIYMLWKECMLVDFYKYFCKKENFSYLNKKIVLHPKVSDIVLIFIEEDENNFKKLRENLRKNKNVFQYVYSVVYPDIYCSSEKHSYDLRSEYLIVFKEYKDRIKAESLGKNAKIYEERENLNEFEQKPIKIDDFTEEEEKKINKKLEASKRKRCETAEKTKN